MMNEVKAALIEKNIQLIWNNDVLSKLVALSYSSVYGARNLRRTIQRELENKIASILVNQYSLEPSILRITVENDRLVIHPE